MELNLAVGDFLWRSPNLFCQLQIHWYFIIYNVTLELPNLFCQSDVLLILPNIFPAIFSAYMVDSFG